MSRRAGRLVGNVCFMNRDRLVGHLYLGSTLMENACIYRLKNSPDNAGHGRDLIAVAVSQGRVHAWLLTGSLGNDSDGWKQPTAATTQSKGLLARIVEQPVPPRMSEGAAGRCRVSLHRSLNMDA